MKNDYKVIGLASLLMLLLAVPFEVTLGASTANTTSGSTKVNSARMKNPAAANMTANYPSQNVVTTVNTVLDYEALPICPGDPRATTVGSDPTASSQGTSIASAPFCPDINYKFPPGTPTQIWYQSIITPFSSVIIPQMRAYSGAVPNPPTTNFMRTYCPKQCRITQRIFYAANGTTINNIIKPICPKGYVKVAEYNSQPEAYKVITPQYLPLAGQKLTFDDVNKYRQRGYTCTTSIPAGMPAAQRPAATEFRGCNHPNSGAYAAYQALPFGSDTTYQGFAGQYNVVTQTTNTSQYSMLNMPGSWEAKSNTVGAGGKKSGYCFYYSAGLEYCNNYAGNADLRPGQGICAYSADFAVWMHYTFNYYVCYSQANSFVLSEYSMPVSYVCARIVTGWENEKDSFIDKAPAPN